MCHEQLRNLNLLNQNFKIYTKKSRQKVVGQRKICVACILSNFLGFFKGIFWKFFRFFPWKSQNIFPCDLFHNAKKFLIRKIFYAKIKPYFYEFFK